jgi:L-lactate dehydrogenase (cytochrome)
VGAEAIVVSNHGGRQLDGVLSSIAVLPRVAQAVDGRMEIFVDGGLRSGLDVVRALALGAKGTLIGRPWAYAVAARGEAGVAALLGGFAADMRVAMALTGVTQTRDIGSGLLEPP